MPTWSKLRQLSPLAGTDALIEAFLAANKNPVQDTALSAAAKAMENSEGVDIGHGMKLDPTGIPALGAMDEGSNISKGLLKRYMETRGDKLASKQQELESLVRMRHGNPIDNVIGRTPEESLKKVVPESFWGKTRKSLDKTGDELYELEKQYRKRVPRGSKKAGPTGRRAGQKDRQPDRRNQSIAVPRSPQRIGI
jgi:hypothetical protein